MNFQVFLPENRKAVLGEGSMGLASNHYFIFWQCDLVLLRYLFLGGGFIATLYKSFLDLLELHEVG